MNERIRDLLPNPFAVDYQVENGPLDLYTEKEMLRFAELIVKECARALDDKLANPNGASMAYCDGSDLLELFGVE